MAFHSFNSSCETNCPRSGTKHRASSSFTLHTPIYIRLKRRRRRNSLNTKNGKRRHVSRRQQKGIFKANAGDAVLTPTPAPSGWLLVGSAGWNPSISHYTSPQRSTKPFAEPRLCDLTRLSLQILRKYIYCINSIARPHSSMRRQCSLPENVLRG